MRKTNNENNDHFFYGASPLIHQRAKELRKKLTRSENILWQELRNRKLGGYKFRRQHPINQFIADFYCHECKLVVEVDGKIHRDPDNEAYDSGRTIELNNLGVKVIRFTNDEIYHNLSHALDVILNELTSR